MTDWSKLILSELVAGVIMLWYSLLIKWYVRSGEFFYYFLVISWTFLIWILLVYAFYNTNRVEKERSKKK